MGTSSSKTKPPRAHGSNSSAGSASSSGVPKRTPTPDSSDPTSKSLRGKKSTGSILSLVSGTSSGKKKDEHRRSSMARNFFGFGGGGGGGGNGDDEDAVLTPGEAAFLSRDVRERLHHLAGQLPPVPASFPKVGAVLFVDISGFTALGDRLRKENVPEVAADKLSRQITHVLNELTKTCLHFGGDVAKFAGDALLCVFLSHDPNISINRAHNCAVEMLMGMRKYNLTTGSDVLQIHGGISKGSIIHFHLGSSDDDIRWYLVAGDAVTGATSLVDKAEPGEILLVEDPKKLRVAHVHVKRTLEDAVVYNREGKSGAGRDGPLSPKAKPDRPMGLLGLLDDSGKQKMGSPRALSPTTSAAAVVASTHSEPGDDATLFDGTSSPRPTISPRKKNIRLSRVSLHSEDSEHSVFRDRPGRQSIGMEFPTDLQEHVNGSRKGSVLPEERSLRSDSNASGSRDDTIVEVVVITADTDQLQENDDVSAVMPTTTTPPRSPPTNSRASSNLNNSSVSLDVYSEALSVSGTSYIPKALRAVLRIGVNTSEMRSNVAVVFVGLPDLSITDEELASQSVSASKLDNLNSSFVIMTRIAHSFQGEVRDLLFDDKGCIYICAFGAIGTTELSALRAVRAAMAISHEYPQSKVGVSQGTCFVGMCGTPKRHDFIVMGHEVNMAARYMVCAPVGTVYVSGDVHESTKQLLTYKSASVQASKHGEELVNVYQPTEEIARRASFLAQYRYGMRDVDLFVGRQYEIQLIETTVNQLCFGDFFSKGPKGFDMGGGRGIITIEAATGMGKSAFVTRVRKLGKGKIKIVTCATFSLEKETKFFCWRQLLEAYTGLKGALTLGQIKRTLEENYGDDEGAINIDALGELLPSVDAAIGRSRPAQSTVLAAQNQEMKRVGSMMEMNKDGGGGGDSQQMSSVMMVDDKMIERVGKEVLKLLVGFRGELSLQQMLAKEPENGALLIFEDVHWMDLASIKLLHYVLERIDRISGIVVLMTFRPEIEQKFGEESDSKRFEALRSLITYAQTCRFNAINMHLLGLNKKESDLLVARVLGLPDSTQVDKNVLEFIFKKTDGYPMYLSLLIEWIKERGLLVKNSSTGVFEWASRDTPNTAKFPNSMADTMIGRLDRLDPQSRNLIKLASVLGIEFDAQSIHAFTEVDRVKTSSGSAALTEKEVVKSLEEAKSLGILVVGSAKRSMKRSAHKWRFTDESVQMAVLKMIPESRMKELNTFKREMAETLEKKKVTPLFAGLLGEGGDDS